MGIKIFGIHQRKGPVIQNQAKGGRWSQEEKQLDSWETWCIQIWIILEEHYSLIPKFATKKLLLEEHSCLNPVKQ